MRNFTRYLMLTYSFFSRCWILTYFKQSFWSIIIVDVIESSPSRSVLFLVMLYSSVMVDHTWVNVTMDFNGKIIVFFKCFNYGHTRLVYQLSEVSTRGKLLKQVRLRDPLAGELHLFHHTSSYIPNCFAACHKDGDRILPIVHYMKTFLGGGGVLFFVIYPPING